MRVPRLWAERVEGAEKGVQAVLVFWPPGLLPQGFCLLAVCPGCVCVCVLLLCVVCWYLAPSRCAELCWPQVMRRTVCLSEM
jgi:hypothetical protein